MSNLKLFLSVFAFALGVVSAAAHTAAHNETHDHEAEEEIRFYELRKGDLLVNFTNFGARIVSLIVPDKFGNPADIVLGYDSVDDYKKDDNSFGAIVGRVANRIGGAKFTLDNTDYKLNENDGVNTLNGGKQGFANVIWNVTKFEKSEENPYITFQYNSSNNEQGFPGNLNVTATYILQDKNMLKVNLHAETKDKKTPVNLAQYTYWNLGGHNSSNNILHDQLQVLASNFTELDQYLVPTGRILPVGDTPFDFQTPHVIESRFDKMRDGYEVNYVVDDQNEKKESSVKLAAVLRDGKSGRVLNVWTDQPVVQFYSGDGVNNVRGKGGILYQRNAGVLLVAQGFPNSVNVESFPSQIVSDGKPYKQTTVFQTWRHWPVAKLQNRKMAAVLPSASVLQFTIKGKSGSGKLTDFRLYDNKGTRFQDNHFVVKAMCASSKPQKKQVWIWTEKKEVMTAAAERGWSTFIFDSQRRQLAVEWSSMALLSPLFIEEGGLFDAIALLYPLFIEEGGLFDGDHMKVATFFEISSPEQLEKLQPLDERVENVVVNLLDWQVIPAENIVAAIQGTEKTVFAVSKTSSEAQIFFEALEQGLGGVVLKTEDVEAIFEVKDYLDRRNNEGSVLELTKARVTNIQMVGMGDRVCVDLCSLMRPGEGLLVGSFARGLFLVHSECLESSYISSRPFRVNAGPVHAYVAIPGAKTSYLSELKAGYEVIIVDQNGMQRTAIIGRVKIETRQLILVEAKSDDDNQTSYSILLQNAETVALISSAGVGDQRKAIPVTSLKLGDEVLLRIQGGARHTGIEIEEFIVEK
ncbi:hypothetical protein BUALT_Bualt04G0147500 [Buddleja alternifolia]|uniref:3-dehydroquinate synthase n=1 Tax=Buddleja alternifolia TaxID=168488 RepID=A0AAV6XP06_9LAMI|nr:hypothetical protein BUALT_Bualt04G0147500 [Buddleja alternifolia]